MANYPASERLCYILSPILGQLLLFFWHRIRPSLRPHPSNPFVFVKPSDGLWFDVNGGDRFGALCGDRGLQWGTSVRVVRHVISTAVAHASQISVEERKDISAANLHTVAISDRYYVVPDGTKRGDTGSNKGRDSGDFTRGLGKMYKLFPETFRQAIGVPLPYESILQGHFDHLDLGVDANGSSMSPNVAVLEGFQSNQSSEVIDNRSREKTLLPNDTANKATSLSETKNTTSRAELRTCSACAKQFPKSKSHRGTRCWACKKIHSRSISIQSTSSIELTAPQAASLASDFI